MDEIDRKLINALQDGIPVVAEPFEDLAAALTLSRDEVPRRLQRLLDEGWLTRFGPLYDADRLGGSAVLAAMAAPDDDFDKVAAKVNAHPEVAHNYQRAHRLNMWFVLIGESSDRIETVIAEIEAETGLKVYSMPKLEEFCIGLRFEA
jgi:DNA-binding Lrp family transcriptional regulator